MNKRIIAIVLAALVLPVLAYDVHYYFNRGRASTEGAALAGASRTAQPPEPGAPTDTAGSDRLAELAQTAFGAPEPADENVDRWADPFSALPAQPTAAHAPGEPARLPKTLRPAAVVTGILFSPHPLAIINGRIVGPGDPINNDGWTVARIEPRWVILELNGATHRVLLAVPGRGQPED